MKLVKKILLSIFFFILLSIILIWTLTKTITPDTVREYVSKQLSLLTHQKSHIDGEFSWQIFPRPGIKVTKIHVGDEHNKANYTLDIDNLLLNLHLSPLLKGNLVFDEIIIDGFSISIDPKHQTNTPPMTMPSLQGDASKSNAEEFAINRFLLMHGRLVVNHPSQSVTISNLQIEAQQLNLKKEFFPLHIKANVSASSNNNTLKAIINYKGRVGFISTTLSDPLKALQQTAMDGQLLIQNFQMNQLKIAKISANTKTRQGYIVLNPLNLSLYNGESIGDLSYQFASKRLILNQTSTNLDAALLTKDIAGSALVKGNLDLSVHASTIAEPSLWQNKLHGNGNIIIKDGLFYFINLDQLINETTHKIHIILDKDKHDVSNLLELTQFSSSTGQNSPTPFQLLSLKYQINNNQLTSDALLMQTEKLQLKGSTDVNIMTRALNGHVVATFMHPDTTIDKIQQMLGGGFPFKISGSYKNPKVLPDTEIINPVIAKYLIQKTLDKPVKQLQKRLDKLLTTSENVLSDNAE